MTVQTGYEGRFDFPHRTGRPERPYLLATVPRSGSTWFSHLLWRTGCLGAPLEYLNFDASGPYGFASETPAEQRKLWQADLARRTSPNGVFGVKAFPIQFEALHAHNPALLGEVMRAVLPSRAASRIVQLRRRDRAAHAISYARAILSGVWRKEQESGAGEEPEYSRLAVERAAKLIEEQEAAWQAMFADLGVEPLVLWYEDALADPEKAITDIAAFLGVTLDPQAEADVPTIERQSQTGARVWAERHQEAG